MKVLTMNKRTIITPLESKRKDNESMKGQILKKGQIIKP